MSQGCLRKAAEDAERQMCHTLYCGAVTKVHNRQGKGPRILVLTDVFVSFYRVKKNPTRDRTMYWPYLTHIAASIDSINLEFGTEHMQFLSGDSNSILQKIIKTVQRILSPDEFMRLGFGHSIENRLSPNGRGVVSRFIGICLKSGVAKMEPLLTHVTKLAIGRCTVLDLSRVENIGHMLVILFKTLRVVDYLESILLPRTERSQVTNAIAEYLKAPFPLRHIGFLGQVPFNFPVVLGQLCDQSGIGLTGMTFTNCNLTDLDITAIQKFMINRGLKSVGFRNSVNQGLIHVFYEAFWATQIHENLMMMNLDMTNDLVIPNLLSVIPNVYSLSLAYCGLDIAEVIPQIAESRITNLVYLNLCGNRCGRSLAGKSLRLPRKMKRIDLADVKWEHFSLTGVVQFLFEYDWNDGLDLSLSRIHGTDRDWNELFAYFGKVSRTPLVSLTWNDNKVSTGLFNMISASFHLRKLIMCGSLSYHSKEQISDFAEHLVHLPVLSSLILKGSRTTMMLSSSMPLVEKLKKIRNLRFVDVSNNQIGRDAMDALINIVSESRTISTVNFDDSGLRSIKEIEEVVRFNGHNLTPLYISWPFTDMARLLAKGEHNSVNYAIQLAETIQKASKEFQEYDPQLPLERPFECTVCESLFDFPLFLTSLFYKEVAKDKSSKLNFDSSFLTGIPIGSCDSSHSPGVRRSSIDDFEDIRRLPLARKGLGRINQTTPHLALDGSDSSDFDVFDQDDDMPAALVGSQPQIGTGKGQIAPTQKFGLEKQTESLAPKRPRPNIPMSPGKLPVPPGLANLAAAKNRAAEVMRTGAGAIGTTKSQTCMDELCESSTEATFDSGSDKPLLPLTAPGVKRTSSSMTNFGPGALAQQKSPFPARNLALAAFGESGDNEGSCFESGSDVAPLVLLPKPQNQARREALESTDTEVGDMDFDSAAVPLIPLNVSKRTVAKSQNALAAFATDSAQESEFFGEQVDAKPLLVLPNMVPGNRQAQVISFDGSVDASNEASVEVDIESSPPETLDVDAELARAESTDPKGESCAPTDPNEKSIDMPTDAKEDSATPTDSKEESITPTDSTGKLVDAPTDSKDDSITPTDSNEKSIETPTDSKEDSTTHTDSTEKFVDSAADSKEDSTTPTDSTEKLVDSAADSKEDSTTPTDSTEKLVDSAAGTSEKSIETPTDSTEKLVDSAAGTSEKSIETPADWNEDSVTSTDSSEESIDTQTDSKEDSFAPDSNEKSNTTPDATESSPESERRHSAVDETRTTASEALSQDVNESEESESYAESGPHQANQVENTVVVRTPTARSDSDEYYSSYSSSEDKLEDARSEDQKASLEQFVESSDEDSNFDVVPTVVRPMVRLSDARLLRHLLDNKSESDSEESSSDLLNDVSVSSESDSMSSSFLSSTRDSSHKTSSMDGHSTQHSTSSDSEEEESYASDHAEHSGGGYSSANETQKEPEHSTGDSGDHKENHSSRDDSSTTSEEAVNSQPVPPDESPEPVSADVKPHDVIEPPLLEPNITKSEASTEQENVVAGDQKENSLSECENGSDSSSEVKDVTAATAPDEPNVAVDDTKASSVKTLPDTSESSENEHAEEVLSNSVQNPEMLMHEESANTNSDHPEESLKDEGGPDATVMLNDEKQMDTKCDVHFDCGQTSETVSQSEDAIQRTSGPSSQIASDRVSVQSSKSSDISLSVGPECAKLEVPGEIMSRLETRIRSMVSTEDFCPWPAPIHESVTPSASHGSCLLEMPACEPFAVDNEPTTDTNCVTDPVVMPDEEIVQGHLEEVQNEEMVNQSQTGDDPLRSESDTPVGMEVEQPTVDAPSNDRDNPEDKALPSSEIVSKSPQEPQELTEDDGGDTHVVNNEERPSAASENSGIAEEPEVTEEQKGETECASTQEGQTEVRDTASSTQANLLSTTEQHDSDIIDAEMGNMDQTAMPAAAANTSCGSTATSEMNDLRQAQDQADGEQQEPQHVNTEISHQDEGNTSNEPETYVSEDTIVKEPVDDNIQGADETNADDGSKNESNKEIMDAREPGTEPQLSEETAPQQDPPAKSESDTQDQGNESAGISKDIDSTPFTANEVADKQPEDASEPACSDDPALEAEHQDQPAESVDSQNIPQGTDEAEAEHEPSPSLEIPGNVEAKEASSPAQQSEEPESCERTEPTDKSANDTKQHHEGKEHKVSERVRKIFASLNSPSSDSDSESHPLVKERLRDVTPCEPRTSKSTHEHTDTMSRPSYEPVIEPRRRSASGKYRARPLLEDEDSDKQPPRKKRNSPKTLNGSDALNFDDRKQHSKDGSDDAPAKHRSWRSNSQKVTKSMPKSKTRSMESSSDSEDAPLELTTGSSSHKHVSSKSGLSRSQEVWKLFAGIPGFHTQKDRMRSLRDVKRRDFVVSDSGDDDDILMSSEVLIPRKPVISHTEEEDETFDEERQSQLASASRKGLPPRPPSQKPPRVVFDLDDKALNFQPVRRPKKAKDSKKERKKAPVERPTEYTAPTWEFPIKTIARPRDRYIIDDLKQEYEVNALIRSLPK